MTNERTPLFRHVLLIGTGLIGASLGLALRQYRLAGTVTGWDRSPQHLDTALRTGAIAGARARLEATGADLIVLATPVGAMPGLLAELALTVEPGAIVTDVGSTKEGVMAAAACLPPGAAFVGGHPMAGLATSGPEAACADLFAGRKWVLCPPSGSGDAVARLTALVRGIGAEPVLRAPAVHDRHVAAVSHLPQVASSALALAGKAALAHEPEGFALAARGWQDMTRLAASSPEMWRDICLANGHALQAALRQYVAELERFAAAIANGDAEALTALFTAAQAAVSADSAGARTAEPQEVAS